MKNIKKANEVTSEILRCESDIEILQYKISEIEKEGSKVEAKLSLEINGNKRGSSTYYIGKEFVVPYLKQALSETNIRLTEFKKQFDEL